jgi:hypothetical protein
MANEAVALGLTVTIVGIVAALGAVTAVCAIAGKAANNANTNNNCFIMFPLDLNVLCVFYLKATSYR